MPGTREEVGRKVRSFYQECSFPGYDAYETLFDLVEKADRGTYAKLLDEQIPLGVTILDAGCGTSQLTNWLAVANRRVVGIDLSMASLGKGHDLKRAHGLRRAQFVQMDLFELGPVPLAGLLHSRPDDKRGGVVRGERHRVRQLGPQHHVGGRFDRGERLFACSGVCRTSVPFSGRG